MVIYPSTLGKRYPRITPVLLNGVLKGSYLTFAEAE